MVPVLSKVTTLYILNLDYLILLSSCWFDLFIFV